jgi:hypothetical protein
MAISGYVEYCARNGISVTRAMATVGVLAGFFGSRLPFRHLFLYEFPMAQKSRPPNPR